MNELTETPISAAAIAPAKSNRRRRNLLAVVVGLSLTAGITYGVYWLKVARYVESTDDAYVAGNVVQVTPQVTGTVVVIRADDTDFVRAGQTLVQLDRADARVALKRGEAQLAQAVRSVRNLYAQTERLEATVAGRRVDLARVRADLERRVELADSGAIAAEDVQHAQDAVRSAQSDLDAASQSLEGNRALTEHTTIASHPSVQRAAAEVRAAYLDYQRTILPAPVSGIVAKRRVQLGQRVAPGKPLMAIVPPDQVWVDANFKEGQLGNIRVGQPVRLTADANGVEYRGTVAGLGAGTGAAFALLPAQNATGNWIKVVQRLPVRIALDRREIEAHPLAIGLSMEVEVDVHDRSGKRLGRTADGDPAYRTAVYDHRESDVETLIADIIERNTGGAATAGTEDVSSAIDPLLPAE